MNGITFGPDELCLLTFEDAEICAYDAHSESPKWTVKLPRPIAGLVLADAQALDLHNGGSPWRAGPTTHAAIAVDRTGCLHVIDTTLGQLIGSTEEQHGLPKALASAGSSVALATKTEVIVWQNGKRVELPLRASALAFSATGNQLAVGTEDGKLYILESHLRLDDPRIVIVGQPVADITQHPDGTWIACARDLFAVRSIGVQKLVVQGGMRVRFDALGKRLAVQHGTKRVSVYEWPTEILATRVDYPQRTVTGIAFGPDEWLGIGLEGDANKVNVETSLVHRTDPHPGRPHRNWTIIVDGKRERAAAREEAEMRRKRVEAESKVDKKPLGGRIGIGALISISLMSVRLCVRSSSPSSSYNYKLPPSFSYSLPRIAPLCNRDCAKDRLETLAKSCRNRPRLGCEAPVAKAQVALAKGKCTEATSALADVSISSDIDTIAENNLTLARSGLKDACMFPSAVLPARKHIEVVHLDQEHKATVEKIPFTMPFAGEVARAVWTSPDGTLFVGTTSDSSRCTVHMKKGAAWSEAYTRAACTRIALAGTKDLYILADQSVLKWSGVRSEGIDTPSFLVGSIAANGNDVFLSTAAGGTVHRRASTGWSKTEVSDDVDSAVTLFSNGGALWAVDTDHNALYKFQANRWLPTTLEGTSTMRTAWVSPSGQAFVGGSSIARTRGTIAPISDVETIWGRTDTDVFAGTANGLHHWDGKEWTEIEITGHVEAIGGTAKETILATTIEE